jgi:hypothetical protein
MIHTSYIDTPFEIIQQYIQKYMFWCYSPVFSGQWTYLDETAMMKCLK